jgi:hypothetical protein
MASKRWRLLLSSPKLLLPLKQPSKRSSNAVSAFFLSLLFNGNMWGQGLSSRVLLPCERF